jgi:Na+-driven multidrug efflux pump
VSLLVKRKLVELKDMFKPPSWAALGTLLVGGAGVQLRAVAQNITFLAVMRAILTMDSTGTAAAAHTISSQVFQLGVIAILALSTIATILIPQRMNSLEKGGPREAKRVADRLLCWGLGIGILLAGLQAGAIPFLGIFSGLSEVQEAAVMPCIIGALLQPLNGLVFVGEGLMQGHQAFLRLAGGMFVSTGAMLIALRFFGHSLAGVWFCFTVFNTFRLFFGLRHHFFDGPLAPRNIEATVAKLEATAASKAA